MTGRIPSFFIRTMATKHRAYLDTIMQAFEDMSYKVSIHVVDAAYYNVPQSRRRLLLIGTRTHTLFTPDSGVRNHDHSSCALRCTCM